ncbi:MAG: hypothetical protein E6X12_09455 [Actinomyces sp.]|uniref:hypothetical protein n=1 Tax=Actinomyces sp. HMSC065F12 TaxID=1739479 RepID=UPI00114CF6FD|nr:hypothetical protein [Actinomyces sp. HMSC065F12]MBS5899862.1 hypothetical protein [Actinomycetaceae bacterium]MDU5006678.1 hypothetical protein [Actinomyces sp.]MDU5116174.1 hypothetical protein [Actinomyces sp.]MDU6662192.1 hypothetical protein [Actinomyces sp.]
MAEKGMQSAAAQRYIAFHEAGKAQWQGILDEAKQPSSGVSGIPGAVGGVSKVSSDPKDVFAKYADRLEGLTDALNDSQKATLGMMYKLASKKGGEDSMQKVEEKLGIDLGSKAGLDKPTAATSSHIETEA